tara:strand:+ start:1374 stop:1883 length:510 start_codon:yes stop_codon:yes gene_type:complete
MNIEIIILITIFALVNMARFTRNEPPNAPIHWLKIPIGDSIDMTIEHVLVGTAKDFSEVLKLAIPNNMLEHRPDTVIAKILLDQQITLPDGKIIGELLMLQSSAVNDLLGLMEEWQKDSKTKKWNCKETDEFDSWNGPAGSKNKTRKLIVSHFPLHSNGSRTSYEVLEG